MPGTEPRRFGHHRNAFGFLRLLFASLVIASHAPELAYGGYDQEILYRLTGGVITLGEVAVFSFFVISGYLIAGSYLNSASWRDYLRKRVARIYPAFVVVFAICVLVVAPIGGGILPHDPGGILRLVIGCLTLQTPLVGGAFDGLPSPALNGSMWTISYEFRCYLLIMALGLVGLLRQRRVMLLITLAMFVLSFVFPVPPAGPATFHMATPPPYRLGDLRGLIHGDPRADFRLASVFLVGTCFYLYRDRLKFTPHKIAGAAVMLVVGLLWLPAARTAVAILGGYLIFAAARTTGPLSRINNENDISYGVYLYAFPITKLILWWWPAIPVVALGLTTFALSCAFGWISWIVIEKPALLWARPRTRN